MNGHLGLKDIQGLDSISFWPLAPGWWVLFGIVLAGGLFATALFLARRRRRLRWEHRLLAKLDTMAKFADTENSEQMAAELAELVRRLAIHRFDREACARLQGDAWLKWLTDNDPKKFDWRPTAKILVEAPFRRPGLGVDLAALRGAIIAAKGWVK